MSVGGIGVGRQGSRLRNLPRHRSRYGTRSESRSGRVFVLRKFLALLDGLGVTRGFGRFPLFLLMETLGQRGGVLVSKEFLTLLLILDALNIGRGLGLLGFLDSPGLKCPLRVERGAGGILLLAVLRVDIDSEGFFAAPREMRRRGDR